MSLEQVLSKQGQMRTFTGQPLKFSTIGQLAWAASPKGWTGSNTSLGLLGATAAVQQTPAQSGMGPQVSPNSQQTYPISVYFALQEGLFLYNPSNHGLEQITNQDVRGSFWQGTLGQQVLPTSGCDIIIACSLRNFSGRGGNSDSRRIMSLEAGRIAQNIRLQAISLELGYSPISDFDTRYVKRIYNLPRNLEPVYIISVGYTTEQTSTEAAQGASEIIQPKKAVLIIASENFRDEELFETKRVLDMAGVQTVIASTRSGTIRGMLGGLAEATVLINRLRVDDYDAIVFIGGPGAVEYFNSPVAHRIAQESVNKGKVLGAICIAPVILANAGVLIGIRATSFPTEQARLIQAGAMYTGTPIERAGLIVTARDPMAGAMFGTAITEILAGR
jgi:protease I